MNYKGIATEIMLTANEEKWQETRDHIADALRHVHAVGAARPSQHCCEDWTYRGVPCPCEGPVTVTLWQDQPDGVR